MEIIETTNLYLHIVAGIMALVTGLLALGSVKGGRWHRQNGRLYFYAMTGVFITGILLAGFRYNRFLLLIAFLSYYSVFCGVRILKLKQLHNHQRPEWYDWTAGVLNTLANLVFVGLGIYYGFLRGFASGAALLSIGFGVGGLLISYANLKPFVVKPQKAHHWYLAHVGNMVGGYIATLTAFLSTVVTRYDVMNPYLAFALPSVVGVPLLLLWQQKVERKFEPIKPTKS